ncbi:hypothetical protein B4903_20425 [Yersinia frederiksenii]|nr:hypothetical protein B4903_20425 [Yersinia frederiksenii]
MSTITHYRNGVPYNAAGEVVITITGGPDKLDNTVSNNSSQRFGSISNSPHRSFPTGSTYQHRRQNTYNPDTFGQSIFEYLDGLPDTAPSEDSEGRELNEKLKNDTKLLAEVMRDITKMFGDEWGRIADNLSQNIRKKKIRNYHDAIATIEKLKSNEFYKIPTDYRNTISDAIKVLDKKTLADNFNRLSAASGLLAKEFTAEAFYSKIEEGFRTGNWKPLMLEIEAWALSGVAVAAMTRFIPYALFSLTLIIPMVTAPVGFAIVMLGIVILASLIDAKLVDKLNEEIRAMVNALRTDC